MHELVLDMRPSEALLREPLLAPFSVLFEELAVVVVQRQDLSHALRLRKHALQAVIAISFTAMALDPRDSIEDLLQTRVIGDQLTHSSAAVLGINQAPTLANAVA